MRSRRRLLILVLLGRPPPHLELAGAVSGEERPTIRKLDGPHFLLGEEGAHLLEAGR